MAAETKKQPILTGRELAVLSILLAVILCVAGGAFGGYYFFGPCGMAKVNKSGPELRTAIDKFEDDLLVASSTSRIALASQINRLQEDAREFRNIEVPRCMDPVKIDLVNGADDYIKAFVLFQGQESDIDVANYMKKGDLQLNRARIRLNDVYACAPFCR